MLYYIYIIYNVFYHIIIYIIYDIVLYSNTYYWSELAYLGIISWRRFRNRLFIPQASLVPQRYLRERSADYVVPCDRIYIS